MRDVYLVTQRKPLEEVEPIAAIRWLLRAYYRWRGFACRDYDGKCYASIEYRGAFENENEARWAANCRGGAVKPIPLNCPLPEETVSYRTGDVPQSEASQWYRQGVQLPFTAIRREDFAERLASLRLLDQRLDTIEESLKGRCSPV